MLHVAIEGSSGTGKTTLATRLHDDARERGMSVRIALEHGFYLNPLAGDKLSQGTAELSGRMTPAPLWICLDQRREALLARASRAATDLFVSETSIISVLLYELAAAHFGIANQLNSMIPLVRSWYLTQPQILRPDLWIFLDAPAPNSLRRLQRKGGSRDLYMQEETGRFLRIARLTIAHEYLPISRVRLFDTSRLPVEQITARILEEITGVPWSAAGENGTLFMLRLLDELADGRLLAALRTSVAGAG